VRARNQERSQSWPHTRGTLPTVRLVRVGRGLAHEPGADRVIEIKGGLGRPTNPICKHQIAIDLRVQAGGFARQVAILVVQLLLQLLRGFVCSLFYGRACRWAMLGKIKPPGPKGRVRIEFSIPLTRHSQTVVSERISSFQPVKLDREDLFWYKFWCRDFGQLAFGWQIL